MAKDCKHRSIFVDLELRGVHSKVQVLEILSS